MSGCDLRYAKLQEFWMNGANLQNANLSLSELQAADFSGADLRGAYIDSNGTDSVSVTEKILNEKGAIYDDRTLFGELEGPLQHLSLGAALTAGGNTRGSKRMNMTAKE